MARYSIRNYNAFVKTVRAKHGLSLPEARATYKAVTEKLGRPARGVDVGRAPRIVAKAAKAAPAKIERTKREKTERIERIIEKAKTPKEKPFSSLEQYMDWFDDTEDYEYEEADGTVDY